MIVITYLPALAKDLDLDANVWRKKYHVFRFVVALYSNKKRYYWIVYTYAEAYFDPSRTSTMEHFLENSKQLKTVKYFFQESSITDIRLGSKYASDIDVFSYF